MPKESSPVSDLQKSLEELASSAPPYTLTEGCLSNEVLLDIMRGNVWCLSTPAVEQHLQTCAHCRELVDYARRQQIDYKQRKEEFLSLIQDTKSRTARHNRVFRALNPLRFAIKPSMAWAGVAVVAVMLASIPFVFAPSRDDPAMIEALQRVARLRVEDAGSAQKIANDLKVATLKGVQREPAQLRAVQNAIDEKRNSTDDATLKQRWTEASNTVTAAELIDRYNAGATASGSPDLVQNQVTDATVENKSAELQIQRKPQYEEEFVFVVRTAKDQVGLQNVNVIGPNGFRLQIH